MSPLIVEVWHLCHQVIPAGVQEHSTGKESDIRNSDNKLVIWAIENVSKLVLIRTSTPQQLRVQYLPRSKTLDNSSELKKTTILMEIKGINVGIIDRI